MLPPLPPLFALLSTLLPLGAAVTTSCCRCGLREFSRCVGRSSVAPFFITFQPLTVVQHPCSSSNSSAAPDTRSAGDTCMIFGGGGGDDRGRLAGNRWRGLGCVRTQKAQRCRRFLRELFEQVRVEASIESAALDVGGVGYARGVHGLIERAGGRRKGKKKIE